MTKQGLRGTVDTAFARLDRAADSSMEASRLLRAALDAAVAGEKAHRRFGAGFARATYRGSIDTAARYFVCKWFLEPATVSSARSAAALRGDCLNASALRELLDSEGKAIDLPGISDIDYARDIAGDG